MKVVSIVLCLFIALIVVDNVEASRRRPSRGSAVVVQSRGATVVVQSRSGFSRSRHQVNVFVR